METPLIGDSFLGDEALIPSLHDDADLLHFLDGLDRHFSAPCPSEESSLEQMLRDTGDTARMCASKSLPDLPMAAKIHCATEFGGIRTMSAGFTAVDFSKQQRGLTRVDSNTSNRSIAQVPEMSSGVIHERWPAESFNRPNETYVQNWDGPWGHAGIQGHGHNCALQAGSPPAQLFDRMVPSVPATTSQVFTEGPLINSGASLPTTPLAPQRSHSVELEMSQEKSADSCSSFDTRPKAGQKRTGSSRGRAKNTEGWRDKNRRIQKAFRERQKEKQRAVEIAIEEMAERVEALEAENRHLQKTLEDATHTVKRSKAAAKDCSAVAVELSCGGRGDAPVRLTSADLQEFNVDRLVRVWGGLVRNMAIRFPEATRQPNGPHAQRLEALVHESCALMWALVDVNPAVLASFVNCDIEAAAPRQDLTPGMWRAILERLQLSPQQCAELVATRRAMLSNVNALRKEREQIRAQAQGMAWTGRNGSLLAADETAMVEQLQSNVEAMQLCTAYYVSHAYTEVLTPLQCAHFFHQCYPFGPDLMSLMAAAASATDEPRTADIFSAVHLKSGGFKPSAEWRKVLVLPLSRLRCTAA